MRRWLLAIAQTLLGMGLLPQVPSQVHRVLGYFLIFLGVLAFGSGSLLEILEYGGCPTWLHLLGGVMIFLHFGLLLHFARAKQRKEHAFAVLSMLLWALYPGWARIVGFFIELHFGIPCGLHAWAGYDFIAASSCALALLLLALREYRISGIQIAPQRSSLNAPSVGASDEQHGFLCVCSGRSDPCMPVARLPAVSRMMSAGAVYLLGHHQLGDTGPRSRIAWNRDSR